MAAVWVFSVIMVMVMAGVVIYSRTYRSQTLSPSLASFSLKAKMSLDDQPRFGESGSHLNTRLDSGMKPGVALTNDALLPAAPTSDVSLEDQVGKVSGYRAEPASE